MKMKQLFATAESVKRDLPNVMVRWNGKPWTARVIGRSKEEASVSPWQSYHGGKFHTIVGPVYSVKWVTIANAINSETRIELDKPSLAL